MVIDTLERNVVNENKEWVSWKTGSLWAEVVKEHARKWTWIMRTAGGDYVETGYADSKGAALWQIGLTMARLQ